MDRLFVTNKLRTLFRTTRDDGFFNTLSKIVSVPLSLIQDHTIPVQGDEFWNRNRQSVVPSLIVFAFLWLNGNMNDENEQDNLSFNKFVFIGLICVIPGAFIGTYIRLRTKVSEAPKCHMLISIITAFVMSIMWIQFASSEVIDLLQLFGFITTLPEALLALTVVSWGNCLGDMAADVAMTKKGFGELAITGAVAGPIFNILIGIGLAIFLGIMKDSSPLTAEIDFSIYDKQGNIDNNSILPLCLLIGQFVVLVLIGFNGILNKFYVSYRFHFIAIIFYVSMIIGLVLFSIIAGVQPPSD